MSKWDLQNGWYLPSAIAVYVGEITANPDKYKYTNVQKLVDLCEMYARETRVCRNCGTLKHIREYCICKDNPNNKEETN